MFFRIQLYKSDTIRQTLFDNGSLKQFIKHRNESLRARFAHFTRQRNLNADFSIFTEEVAEPEIDELLKNYMDVKHLYKSYNCSKNI